MLCDDDRYAFVVNGFLDGGNTLLHIIRFDHADMFNSEPFNNLFNRNLVEPVIIHPFPINARVRLMAGHGGNLVI